MAANCLFSFSWVILLVRSGENRPFTGVQGDKVLSSEDDMESAEGQMLSAESDGGFGKMVKFIDMMFFLFMIERLFNFCHELSFLIHNHV